MSPVNSHFPLDVEAAEKVYKEDVKHVKVW